MIVYLYKSQIRPRMEYCSHIWAGSSKHSLSSLDRIQYHIRGLVGEELFSSLQSLSHRRNVASLALLYRYFHGKCSDELHSLVPPLRVFKRNTRFAKEKDSHPYFLALPMVKHKFHATSFLPRTAAMWNALSLACFPPNYNLDLFKANVNRFAASF